MGLYSSIITHSGILEDVVYFKYNDKMLHFEKDHQHQVGFVLTMLLRIVASLLMQVKKQKSKKPKACSICGWNLVPLQSIFKRTLAWTDQLEDMLYSTSRYWISTVSQKFRQITSVHLFVKFSLGKHCFINWRKEAPIRYIFAVSH